MKVPLATAPVAVVLVALCALAGCSQLAGPVDRPTPTTQGPIEGTRSPMPDPGQPHPPEPDGAPATTVVSTPTATATATPSPTRTATLTPTATATATRTPFPTATRTPFPTATRTPTATPSPTRTATPTATRTPNPAHLVLGRIDPPGETVTLRNAGGRRLELGGYVLDFDDGQRYTLPSYVLRPGAAVTVHTGRGDDRRTDLYAGFFYPVINAGSDTILVETSNGRVVAGRRATA